MACVLSTFVEITFEFTSRETLSDLKATVVSYHLCSHTVKMILVVIFAIKNTSVTIRFLLHTARGSIEHSLNC